MVIYKVIKMLAEITGIEPEDIPSKMPLTKENRVDPVELSSLIIACEKEFRITIHDEDVLTFGCLWDLAAHIDKMLDEGLNEMPEVTQEDRTPWFYE